MDQAVLVKERVRAGEWLIHALRGKQLDITAACGAVVEGIRGWRLYLVSP